MNNEETPNNEPLGQDDATSFSPQNTERENLNLNPIFETVNKIRAELGKVIIGQHELIDLVLAALFCRGHVLVEGVPGIAKTLTMNMLSKALDLDFKRIQFTPDLMPTDVTGTSIFNLKTSDFEYKKGPIFSNLVLIDEINRAPAKTQASLFEVMEERQVSFDGNTMKLSEPFMVVATQNPIEQEGTYKLPEAQQDRFIFKIIITYPSLEEEVQILERFQTDFKQNVMQTVQKVLTATEIENCRNLVEKVYIKNELIRYIATLIDKTRNTNDLYLGASPRASLAILKASKAIAAMQGRDFVTPEDIKYVAFPVLNHRVILTPEKEMEGYDIKDVLKDIFEQVEVPR
jgi:MoxR-like ATPase